MPEAHPPPGTDTNTTLGMAAAHSPGRDWHDLSLLSHVLCSSVLSQAGSQLSIAMLAPPPEGLSASDPLLLTSLGVNVG